MTKIIEIKDKVFKFWAEYEIYLTPVYKFIIAFVLFSIISNSIGFMESINSLPVILVISLVCCLLSQNMTILIASIVVLLNLYALSIEVALVALLVFAVLYFIYFRFAPKFGIWSVLTPILFHLNIPYILPIGCGLLSSLPAVLGVVCSTVAFFFIDGIYQNVTTLSETVEGAEVISKLSVTVSQLLGNKEMYLVIGIFILTTIAVYIIRKLTIDHAWKIAIISGVLIQVSGLFAGYMVCNISGKTVAMILGNIVALVFGFVIEFLFMDLDYERTERLQFEDDDYYYYVKAVPKKTVATSDKKVKQFGNTLTKGRKNAHNSSMLEQADSRKRIAQELEIDEDLLK
ncbi:MAG: hypothetical protein IKJ01_10420 [Lachnospiraceae bacterium]|nr:hypothetical protein [Lachnospiraceae bacterium]